ncbi:MAG: inositol monophosphatase family protein [Steroidobacteraceae bacterium]
MSAIQTRSELLEAALEAAAAAREIILRHYRSKSLEVSLKADRSPVTEADVAAERVIHEVLKGRFPAHGFFGEETGSHSMMADHIWLVDPIDGTKSFVRGYPMFSTQIALLERGRLVLGVSCAPAYGQTCWAERGGGAWLDGEPIAVSGVEALGDATLSTGNLRTLALGPAWGRFGGVVGSVNRIRGYGDFLHYHLLASGRIDAVVESDVNILDIAALSVIVEEAGGHFTDLGGGSVGFDTTSVLATNGRLHAGLLEAIRYA